MASLQVTIIGVYHVHFSDEHYATCMELLGGYGMNEADARDQLATVKLIEVEILNHKEKIDFCEFAQEDNSKPRSEWQVAYDERKIEETASGSRWVFFLHYVDFSRPLLTPAGAVTLPVPVERPPRFDGIDFFPP